MAHRFKFSANLWKQHAVVGQKVTLRVTSGLLVGALEVKAYGAHLEDTSVPFPLAHVFPDGKIRYQDVTLTPERKGSVWICMRAAGELQEMTLTTYPALDALEPKVGELVGRWVADAKRTGRGDTAYREILALGTAAVPSLCRMMVRDKFDSGAADLIVDILGEQPPTPKATDMVGWGEAILGICARKRLYRGMDP